MISFTYSIHELSHFLNFRNVFSVKLDSIFHEFPDKGVSRMVQGREILRAKLCETTTPDPTLMKYCIKGVSYNYSLPVRRSTICDTKFSWNCTNFGWTQFPNISKKREKFERKKRTNYATVFEVMFRIVMLTWQQTNSWSRLFALRYTFRSATPSWING